VTEPTLLQRVRAKQSELVRAALEASDESTARNLRRSFKANRDMCAGWSVVTNHPCQLFAKPGKRFCRYHEEKQ
jgi:hypothetical protein